MSATSWPTIETSYERLKREAKARRKANVSESLLAPHAKRLVGFSDAPGIGRPPPVQLDQSPQRRGIVGLRDRGVA